jgi:hypothetical protein
VAYAVAEPALATELKRDAVTCFNLQPGIDEMEVHANPDIF